MHIAIDAHSVGTGLGGNETYATNLIEALAEVDRVNNYTLYVTKQEAVDRFHNRWPNFQTRVTLPHTPVIRIPLTLTFETRKRPVDILHVQYTAPPVAACPVITTIHDLSFEHLPETFNRRSWMQMRLTVRSTARRAAHIITDSSYSRNDILKTYGLPGDRVTVTPLAASTRYRRVENADEIKRVREKFGITGDYILAVGSIQPRKNIARLIRAYLRLRDESTIDPMPRLVIAGKPAWLYDDTIKVAERSGAKEYIVFTGYVPEEELPVLYSDARCFVYPSYFEGFGIPPLESMRCGTPVITSNRTCFPEVIGDAGLMVDTLDEGAIAAAIKRLLTDEHLHHELSARGLKRAQLFDWRETARLTLNVYEQVYAERYGCRH